MVVQSSNTTVVSVVVLRGRCRSARSSGTCLLPVPQAGAAACGAVMGPRRREGRLQAASRCDPGWPLRRAPPPAASAALPFGVAFHRSARLLCAAASILQHRCAGLPLVLPEAGGAPPAREQDHRLLAELPYAAAGRRSCRLPWLPQGPRPAVPAQCRDQNAMQRRAAAAPHPRQQPWPPRSPPPVAPAPCRHQIFVKRCAAEARRPRRLPWLPLAPPQAAFLRRQRLKGPRRM